MNEVIECLASRKSCRSFKPQHVGREELDAVLRAGLNAPTGMNKQTPLFIAVSDDEVVAELSRMNAAVMNADIDPFYGAKDVIAVVARKECTYIYDGSLAMGNLLNAAYSLGFGCIWIHRAKEVFESPEGKAFLATWGIEDDVEGIGFCALGIVDEEKPQTVIEPNRVFYV